MVTKTDTGDMEKYKGHFQYRRTWGGVWSGLYNQKESWSCWWTNLGSLTSAAHLSIQILVSNLESLHLECQGLCVLCPAGHTIHTFHIIVQIVDIIITAMVSAVLPQQNHEVPRADDWQMRSAVRSLMWNMEGSSCSLKSLLIIYLTFLVTQLTEFYQVLQLCSQTLLKLRMKGALRRWKARGLQAPMGGQVVEQEVEDYIW